VESGLRARFARDTLLPLARRLRDRALRAYQAGETGVLPVLDALRSERDATLAGVQDLLAYQTALADWEALLGTVP
jgi:outer membrane protein TolC